MLNNLKSSFEQILFEMLMKINDTLYSIEGIIV